MKTLTLIFLFLFNSNTFSSEDVTAPDSQPVTPPATHLDQEKFKQIAKKLFAAQKLLPENYEYAGNISLGMYFLRYLGELAPFELHANDISQLVVAIEELYGEELNETLKHILLNIRKLKFKREKNKFTTKIYTKGSRDIKVPIEVEREGIVSSINDFWIEHKSEIKLHSINNDYYRKKYYRMLLKRKELFQLPKVHLVEENYANGLKYYLSVAHEIPPLVGSVEGMGINLSLNRWFPKSLRSIDLDIGEIGSFLGIKDLQGNSLSPFWLSGKKWGVHVISTFDN